MNLNSDSLSKTKAKRLSNDALIESNAPGTACNDVWVNSDKIFPGLISDLLTDGHKVKFRAPGESMYPTICDGDILTVMPIETESITIGDIILYRHKSGVSAHRVMRTIKPTRKDPQRTSEVSQNRCLSETLHFVLRGDAALDFDDPVSVEQILGKVTLVEREGRRINPYTGTAIIRYKTRRLAARIKRLFTRSD